MKKFTTLTDIWKAGNIPRYIADSMEQQMLRLCRDYLTLDISAFGAFFYIEDVSDLDRYAETGMSERIEDAEPEFVEVLKDAETKKRCYQTCHVIHTDYAIYVFCEYDTVKANLSDRQGTQNSAQSSAEPSESLRDSCSV